MSQAFERIAIYARYTRADPAENLIGNRPEQVGPHIGIQQAAGTAAEKNHFISFSRIGYIGDIDSRHIHGDGPQHIGPAITDDHPRPATQCPPETVGVADGQCCHAHPP